MEPVPHKQDLCIVRQLSKWEGGSISVDIQYLIYMTPENTVISAKEVIGKSSATFSVWIPQKIVYRMAKLMKQKDSALLLTESYTVQHSVDSGIKCDPNSNDATHWAKEQVEMNDEERMNLKKYYLLPEIIKKHTQAMILSQKGEIW